MEKVKNVQMIQNLKKKCSWKKEFFSLNTYIPFSLSINQFCYVMLQTSIYNKDRYLFR